MINEKIHKEFTQSISAVNVMYFDKQHPNPHDFGWHYHEELELVYITEGVGRRKIGMSLTNFQNGDLILIGSNVPHHGFTTYFSENRKEVVVHFKASMLGSAFETAKELKNIHSLFEAAKNGVVFENSVKHKIGKELLKIKDKNDFEKIICLLNVLHEMANTKDKKVLNARGESFLINPKENDRINQVLNYIEQHYKENITLNDVSQIVYMSPSSFSRFFKKTTAKTFINYLNEYRINNVIKLLMSTDDDVQTIGYQCGFVNMPNFYRQFKKQTGYSPNEYRKKLED